MLHAGDDKRLVAGEGMQMVISSQGHVVDRFICFSIQSLYVARPLGHQLILLLCSEVIAQT